MAQLTASTPTGARVALLVVVAALAAACSSTPSSVMPSPSSDEATAGPTASAVGDDTPPSAGECAETDQPIGILTSLRYFRVAPCESAAAQYRVLAVLPVGVPCPDATAYRVQLETRQFCLVDKLAADSPAAATDPSIETDLSIGDCVHTEGDVTIDTLTKVACTSSTATGRVVATFDSIVPECPKGTDRRLTLTLPLSSGGGNVVLCLSDEVK